MNRTTEDKIIDMIIDLHNFYYHYGKFPIQKDLKKNGLKSHETYRQYFGGLQSSILDCSGLPTEMYFKWENKDFLREYHRKYYTTHREEIIERVSKYCLGNKESIAQYKKEYALKNRDVLTTKRKQYVKDNYDVLKEYSDRYYKENKKMILEKCKIYSENNKEHIQERRKKHYQKNRLAAIEYSQHWTRDNPIKAKANSKAAKARRKSWGFEPINDYFDNADGHHLHIDNHLEVMYIPAVLHNSLVHRHDNLESMQRVNDAALEWFFDNNQQFLIGRI